MFHDYVLIKGAGDLASGVAALLHKAGFPVVMTEISAPTCVRRLVSFAEAVYQKETWVEDIQGVLVEDFSQAMKTTKNGQVALMVDPDGQTVKNYPPKIFIDGSMTKKNINTSPELGEIVMALGPGFAAGKDAHLVIETKRGPELGKLIFDGFATPDTGVPGDVLGHTKERLLRTPSSGVFQGIKVIGDFVEKGETVALVDGQPVVAQISGTVRGLLKSGLEVYQGMKAGDIHPEKNKEVVSLVTDKAWTIGLSALKGILALTKEEMNKKTAVFAQLNRLMTKSQEGLVYTLLDGGGLEELTPGFRLLLTTKGEKYGTLGLPALDLAMIIRGKENMGKIKDTRVVTWQTPWANAKGNIRGKNITLLEETVLPQKKLIIFGGGHISLPLAEIAAILDYQVLVVDDREEFANKNRFPMAEKTICAPFRQVLTEGTLDQEINSATSVVIVTRGHSQDKVCAEHLLGKDLAYLGMIGSKHKVEQTFKALLKEGYPQGQLAKISAPIGLDLGGQSPAEVALSILAEMVANEYQGSGQRVQEMKGVTFS